jgi:hypothetical protein
MKKWLYIVAAASLAACGGANTNVESSELVGADEKVEFTATEFPAQTKMVVGAPVNLRTSPSRDAVVSMIVPADAEVTLLQGGLENGFYKVSYADREGWVYGAYLSMAVEIGQTSSALTLQEIDTVNSRASLSQGYSYWWGGAVFGCGIEKGSCSGGTHYGSGGSDCSGLVTQAWRVPSSSNSSTCVQEKPYNTQMLYDYRYYWTQESRSDPRKMDALVTKTGGHTFLRISGDTWGTMEVWECGNCSTGCRYTTRGASSDYILIRRHTGWL